MRAESSATAPAASLVDWLLHELRDGPAPAGDGAGHGYAAERLCAILGVAPQALRTRLEEDLALPGNREALEHARGERDQGLHEPYALELTRPSGLPVRVLVLPRPVLDDQGRPAGSLAGVVEAGAAVACGDQATHAARELRYHVALGALGALDAGSLGLWEWEAASGRLRLDPGLPPLLGYHAPDPEASDQAEGLLHPDDQALLQERLRRQLGSGDAVLEAEVRLLRRDGSTAWALLRGATLHDAAGRPRGVAGALLDITDRREAEQAVESERRRLFTLLDRLPAYICLIGPDHSVRFANRLFTDHFGRPRGRPCYALQNKRDEPCELCPTFDVFDTKSLSVWEWDCEHLDRTFQIYAYPFEDLDNTPLVLELGIDVTRSKRAQEALRASEERYRGISDNLAMGLAVVDRERRIVAANPMFRNWLPHADLDATPDCARVFGSCLRASDPDAACAACGCRKTFADGAIHMSRVEADLATGRRTLQMTACPVKDAAGGVDSVVVMAEDVTERLQVEARLQRSQKLEALGTLAAGIAHEINQPLNALQLYATGLEMLLEKSGELDMDTVLTRLSWILKESSRIQEIITHMRALVRQEGSHGPDAVDVNRVVEEALSLIQAQLGAHGIGLDLDLQEGLPPARANPVQLQQVLINLTANAMQALDALDGAERPDKRIVLSTRLGSDQVVLAVRDNGPGLRDATERVFDPFFSTKDAGKGMGLGLSIVHTFVTSWGGEVSARNNPDQGATFSVRLPAAGKE